MTRNKKLFLSAVSSEFLAYRELLTRDLKRPTLDVAVQEDFGVTAGSTLEKLDDYIRACDGIIHLIGKAAGGVPGDHAVAKLLALYPDFADKLPPLAELLKNPQPGFSYTQWEGYLALYHQRPLFIYHPIDFDLDTLNVPRGPKFAFSVTEVQSQKEHYRRICDLGHDRGRFLNEERLSSAVLRDLVEILPRLEPDIEVPPTRLPQTAERLIGRDEELALLDAAWNDPHKNVVVVRAFGGMGKTSLAATWMAEMALKNWRGAERVFDWSFYSQGSGDQRAASADSFIAAALTAFGDPNPVLGSPWDRGARLADLVGKTGCLLVLDGLEPLQYPPGPMEGKLRDAAVEALLKGLAARNAGLCLVTTREKVPDIRQHYGRTADDIPLTALSDLAGAALLHHHGATRAGAHHIQPEDRELQAASREVRGHGLTLQLLGQYLRLAEGGDILKRDTVRLAEADREYQNDATRPYGHAFKAMEAYERWFQRDGGERGQRQLAVLRLLGLFDRPASRGCLDALRAAPVIAGLTEPLTGLPRRDWNITTSHLQDINLLTVAADGSLDAHPLLREYFAMSLRDGGAGVPPNTSIREKGVGRDARTPDAWRAAHRRLYEHLCASTQEGEQPTLEDLQFLYQATGHACGAGEITGALSLFRDRILRGNEFYSTGKVGTVNSDLSTLASFYDKPWTRLLPGLSDADQAWLLNECGYCLRIAGRPIEAAEPLKEAIKIQCTRRSWEKAAIYAANLSELELLLGDTTEALKSAKMAMDYASRCDEVAFAIESRAVLGTVLHQSGLERAAKRHFQETEQVQTISQDTERIQLVHHSSTILHSTVSGTKTQHRLRGAPNFWYCDLFLGEVERTTWRVLLASHDVSVIHDYSALSGGGDRSSMLWKICDFVEARVLRNSSTFEVDDWLLHIAFDNLIAGRASLYRSILKGEFAKLSSHDRYIKKTIDRLRQAGTAHELPRALLTRAWLRSLTGSLTGPESAQSDLDEAWEIAERGPMRLFLADIHLHRARLFFREAKYPWDSPQADLAAAEKLINDCGYHRRDEELADAKAAILGEALSPRR